MRLFVATGIFHPESGGPATYLHHLLPEVVARGHQVTLLTFGDTATADYPYPVIRISRQPFYPERQWQYYQTARRLWPGHDVAFVHSFNIWLPPGIGPKIGKMVGDPAWERATNQGWLPPDVDIDTFQQTRFQPLVEINKWQRAAVARHWDHIIVPSEHRRKVVTGWGVPPERVTVIYNALAGETFIPKATQIEARRALGLSPLDAPLLLTVARLLPLKGIHHTLHALARLGAGHLILVGDGPMQTELEHLTLDLGLSDRVHYVGRVPHAEVAMYYRAADYTLLYSGGEGLSHVLLESLRCGTPAIASDKGGNPEVVQDGVNGLIARYVDVDHLADVLRRALQPGMREALAARTDQGLEQFSWTHMVDETLRVLQSVGDSHQGKAR